MKPRLSAMLSALVCFATAAQAAVSFNRDIRPIMADTCFRCHGPDKNARMAGMRLDIRDEALKPTADHLTPIVPGDPDHSAIIQRIFANPARVMPPAYAHRELTQKQKETIRQWVAEGAKYEGHWAYQPVKRPAVPEIANPPEPIRNPIDAFIQARLAKEGLAPSPEADRRTLIRRVTLDLTGLAPTSEDVTAFVNDKSADAYEKVVDRLLASPRYAEQQALHWLDAIRYADTCGFHGDNIFPAWPYRDWVLAAFRDNMPFDEFTRDQLAGDLLPNATLAQRVASAYNRLNRTSAEGGLQPKEYLAKYAADRARTVSNVWLASTMGCAECHDHKFDPFLSRDFYSMEAFFADVEETGLVPDKGPKAWGTQLELPTREQAARRDDLQAQLARTRPELLAATQALESRRQAEWEKQIRAAYDAGKLEWRYQRPIAAEATNGARLTIYNDEQVDVTHYDGNSLTAERQPGNGLVVAGGANPDNTTYTVRFKPGAGDWTAVGLEVIQDDGLPGLRLARGADRLVVTEVDGEIGAQKLAFNLATTSATPSNEYPAMAAIDGDSHTGWGVNNYADNSSVFLALRLASKLHTDADSVITVRVHHDSEWRRATVGRFRVALSDAQYAWPDPDDLRHRQKRDHAGLTQVMLKALETEAAKRTDEEKKTIHDLFQWSQPELEGRLAGVLKLEAGLSILESRIPHVVTTVATEPRQIRVLPRGNFLDETGPIVTPAVPVFMGKLDTAGRRATRLDLANWIVSRSNPLTARVFVNRAWRQFFGIGLVKTLDDFGSQGEWPVDEDLLDWMASEFMEHWDMRQIMRTIVTSHTYRQSSLGTPQQEERDPDNRLVARQSRFRVDAEVVHDIALEVSGLLVEKFGGPSVKPYEPDGYLAALNFPRREYSASHGDDLYRRGVYTLWQRSFLHPSLLAFDAPTREECTINRVNSNTPLQALVLLNDPIYVEAARVFAEHILEHGGRGVEREIDWAFQRALSRKPEPEERRILEELHAKSLARFHTAPADATELIHAGEAPVAANLKPADLAAMTTVARAILNLHEVITRN